MSEDRKIVPAALAATVLLVRDDPFEVLMVKRRSSSFYASALVFPGGLVEALDAAPLWGAYVHGGASLDDAGRALRIAAYREVHEETNIILAPEAAQEPRNLAFADLVRARDLQLDLDVFAPFGHWITPEAAPKRFDTHFFLARAPSGVAPESDNNETVSLEWLAPANAIARAEAGDYSILFPTLMNLKRLAESTDAEQALQAARARPIFTVKPSMARRDGQTIISIPEEAGYGVTEYVNPSQSTLLGARKDRK